MPKLPLPEVLVEMLARGPAHIEESTVGLADAQTGQTPPDYGWSVNEVLAHLRSCADVWGRNISTILLEKHSIIQALSPPSWLAQTNYLELPFSESFPAFAEQRGGLVTQLRHLHAGDWVRSAMVVGAGRPVERTVHLYTEWIAVHERAHLKQIRRIALAIRP